MRVILTGCTGFLGGHLVEAFQQQGHSVGGIIRSNAHAKAPVLTDIELFEASLHDRPRLQQAMKGADIVVHAAAKVHTHGLWREFVDGTIDVTRDVMHAAINAGVPRFVQISTVGVYGFPNGRNNRPFRETDAMELSTAGIITPAQRLRPRKLCSLPIKWAVLRLLSSAPP